MSQTVPQKMPQHAQPQLSQPELAQPFPVEQLDASAGQGFARHGGLAASDVSSMVRTDEPTFLMSPGEGQLMTIPSESAQPIDQMALSQAMVDAQMEGKPVSSAITKSLEELGYAVYSRPWGDWSSDLLRTIMTAVGA